MTDWYTRCAYDSDQKRRFHRAARAQPRRLAKVLGFPPCSFDLRSNAGGIAVSGEITLHHERIYVQVCQPATGWDTGILIRTCQGRCDYTGGPNNFAPLALLDDTSALADEVRKVMEGRRPGFATRTARLRTVSPVWFCGHNGASRRRITGLRPWWAFRLWWRFLIADVCPVVEWGRIGAGPLSQNPSVLRQSNFDRFYFGG